VGRHIDWKQLLAYITGSADQELLVRNEYLLTENRLLRQQITARVRLHDGERKTLPELGKRLGKQALKEVTSIITSNTFLGNILKRHGIACAPERRNATTWKECIRTHPDVLVATDFLTTEMRTASGLVTYESLFFLHLGSRKVHVAGVTPHPDQQWMVRMARNVAMVDWGFLAPGPCMIHDRDGKLCPAFRRIIDKRDVIGGKGGRAHQCRTVHTAWTSHRLSAGLSARGAWCPAVAHSPAPDDGVCNG
jgi:hypothetical protein